MVEINEIIDDPPEYSFSLEETKNRISRLDQALEIEANTIPTTHSLFKDFVIVRDEILHFKEKNDQKYQDLLQFLQMDAPNTYDKVRPGTIGSFLFGCITTSKDPTFNNILECDFSPISDNYGKKGLYRLNETQYVVVDTNSPNISMYITKELTKEELVLAYNLSPLKDQVKSISIYDYYSREFLGNREIPTELDKKHNAFDQNKLVLLGVFVLILIVGTGGYFIWKKMRNRK